MPIEVLKKNTISVCKNGELSENKLAKQLIEMGYEKNYQVEAPGQFSIRGGIIDIFDLTQENPYRIELWGEDVESIRSFDLLSQRSIERLSQITIYPATEFVLIQYEHPSIFLYRQIWPKSGKFAVLTWDIPHST
jgi:transcription-repair coupling factor (superfamily II helicase)